jgi:hypothetical protein
LPVVVPMRGPGGAAVWATAQPSLAPTVFTPSSVLARGAARAGESSGDELPLTSFDAIMEEAEALSPDRVVQAGMGVAAALSLGLVLPDAAALVDTLRRRRRLRMAFGVKRGPARG